MTSALSGAQRRTADQHIGFKKRASSQTIYRIKHDKSGKGISGMNNCEVKIELEDDTVISLDVEYVYFRGIRGHRDSLGVPTEPDDEPAIEIVSVKQDGADYTTTDCQDILIEEKCWEDLNQRGD